jgi:hypothetical protein
MMRPIITDTWLACRARATEKRVQRVAGERMRTMVALVFAFHFSGSMRVFHKSGGDVSQRATYFPADGSHTGKRYIQMHIGEIVPPLFNDIEIALDEVDSVQKWYCQESVADQELKKRAFAATQFIHNAILADELEQFIHFFIALDAMFGVRGNVESSIADGIGKVFGGDSAWRLRAHRLFELRSELLHGGTSSIDAWRGYEAYNRHFKSTPLNDVATMALTSIRLYPSVQ